ncbi:MAG: hypothetical protein WD512_09165 [Candidatus Paceibacterota bacterium]
MFSNILSIYTDFTQSYPFANYYLQGLSISFVIWMLYLELNPKLGGIFFRPDSNNVPKFKFTNVIPMLKYPFQNWNFWYPSNWDLNFMIFSNIGSIIYTVLKI